MIRYEDIGIRKFEFVVKAQFLFPFLEKREDNSE